MADCSAQILAMTIPTALLNFIGTTLAIVVSHYIDRVLWRNSLDYFDYSSEDESLDEGSEDSDTPNRVDRPSAIVNDDDLIAAVRNFSVLSVVNADNSPNPRKAENETPTNSETTSGISEFSFTDEKSKTDLQSGSPMGSMAGTLIAVTRQIAATLEGATNIPLDKKQELATLLKGIPGFIGQVADMKEAELQPILTSEAPAYSYTSTSEQHKRESEFLLRTLEELE